MQSAAFLLYRLPIVTIDFIYHREKVPVKSFSCYFAGPHYIDPQSNLSLRPLI